MRTTDKLALGLLAGFGAAWGAKALLRRARQIDLAGRVVVITGSTTGLGFIAAQQAARMGAKVVLNGRDEGELRAAEADLRRLGAGEVFGVLADVSDEDQARRLVDGAVGHFGAVDVLVNNAGVIIVGPAAAMTLADYRRLMDTNFWGAVYTTQAALPHMRGRKFGRIANVVSLGGRAVIPHMVPYCASKFALTGFTKALRAELTRDNVFVTGIYPGPIRTGGFTHALFKGNQQAEYAWFSTTDALPLLAISAETAATKLWRAVCGGEPELVLGLSPKLSVLFEGMCPSLSAELTSLVEKTMPAAANLDAPAVRGEDLRGAIPDRLNRMVPENARP